MKLPNPEPPIPKPCRLPYNARILPLMRRTQMPFLSFDGIDGVGKSTQIERTCQWLKEAGHDVVRCRDPGSTKLGEAVRKILLGDSVGEIALRAEMLLYMAARAQMVEELIAPALAERKTVVSDRFLLSNVAYQGHAGGLDVDELWRIGRTACRDVLPDLSIVLDLSPEAATARLNRPLDRLERQADLVVKRRDGFLMEAARDPEHIVVVDASRDPDLVHADVRQAICDKGLA